MKKIIALLLSIVAGANLAVAGQASTPHEKELLNAAKAGNAAQVGGLLEEGIDPNITDKDGNTPLIYAAKTNLATVDMLLQWGADVNAKGYQGLTPLINSFKTNAPIAIRQRLIQAKANVNAVCLNKDSRPTEPLGYSNTALSYAVANNDIEGAKLLLQHGADINARLQHLPLTTALINKNSVQMVEFLLDNGANPCWHDFSAGSWARYHKGDKQEAVAKKALMKAFKNSIKSQCIKDEQLSAAVYKGETKKVKKLLAKGANPNMYHLDSLISRAKNLETAKALIEAGADVNITDYLGYTPLFSADTVEKAELLVNAGANIHAQDYFGQNALFNALLNNHQDVANWLIRRGLKLTPEQKRDLARQGKI